MMTWASCPHGVRTRGKKREELAVRQSGPKSWTVAFIPTPETFAPLPTSDEIVVNSQIQWRRPPSLQQLETRTVVLPILSLAEVGPQITWVSADNYVLQLARKVPTSFRLPCPWCQLCSPADPLGHRRRLPGGTNLEFGCFFYALAVSSKAINAQGCFSSPRNAPE